jgi:hypothetical protein
MKLLRKTIRGLLLESYGGYDKLTREENFELRLLGHDKNHIDINNSLSVSKAFEHYSEPCSMPLYRGVYNTESRILESSKVGDIIQLGRVTSLSENESIGMKWAKRNRQNMIELVPGAEGFNLAALIVHYYDKWEAEDPYDFKMQDGDWPRQVAQKEAEWLMAADATYEVLDISQRDGVNVYRLRMV